MNRNHKLKTVQPFFERVWECSKTFEVIKNDRDFQGGDWVTLQEYDQKENKFSGREVYGQILYVLYDFEGLADGYVAFSIDVKDWINPNNITK
jgi:hypothetical protein